MNYKKLFLGALAIAIMAVGGITVARADDNHGTNENEHAAQNHNQENDAKMVGSTLEVHITNSGNVLVRGAKVTAISGTTITAATAWGTTTMSWTVNTDANTKLMRRYGGTSALAEIAVGDFISFQGSLNSTGSSMTVLAKTLKDWSVQKKNATFEGNVSSVSGTTFVLATKKDGNITVSTSSSTQIMKNNATGAFTDIMVNGKVNTTGLYNNLTHTLEASKVMVKIEQPKPMAKEGTVKSIAGTVAPTTFVLASGGTDYTVRIVSTTSVLSNNWLSAPLTSFAIGNSVRVYGVVNADNTIDATVVRNTNL